MIGSAAVTARQRPLRPQDIIMERSITINSVAVKFECAAVKVRTMVLGSTGMVVRRNCDHRGYGEVGVMRSCGSSVDTQDNLMDYYLTKIVTAEKKSAAKHGTCCIKGFL